MTAAYRANLQKVEQVSSAWGPVGPSPFTVWQPRLSAVCSRVPGWWHRARCRVERL